MTQLWPISGGIHPPQNKQQTCNTTIRNLPLPEHFYLSLLQDRGAQLGEALQPVVMAGDYVKKGQLIATGVGIQAVPLHAPTSGHIGQVIDRPLNHPSGNPGPHIELISDGLDQWHLLTACEDPFKLDKSALLGLIQQAGICGMGGAGFPTALKLSTEQPIHTLILNGTECEPYITTDDRLMQEEPTDILNGALLCAQILGAQQIKIAIEDNKPQAITSICTAIKSFAGARANQFHLATLPTIYPSGGTKQLVQILTGQQVPSGQQATSLGLMVINVATVRAVWRAVRWGEPLIERVTTLSGSALKQQSNIWVRIGTPVRHILNELGWSYSENSPLILGGPLMGFTLKPDASLGKTSNCVIAPLSAEMPPAPEEAPCIRCGQCDSVCPAQLLPQQLFWHAKAKENARLINHNLFDCIECGACSYVCPSTIPLVHYYRHAKADIRAQQEIKLKADHARSRFEAHQARIEQQEADKQAKRTSRQAAAVAIQTQLDLSAMPTPAVPEQSAENIAAKLQRHRQSAQERLDRLKQQFAEEPDAARHEKLAASIKQAQVRLSEAELKIAELTSQNSADKALAKLHASPQQLANQAFSTLHKQLAITEEKLLDARANNLPSLHALTLAVEKLRHKIHQASSELPDHSAEPAGPDAATLAAAEQALARLAAKKTQTAEEKKQALIESVEKRIQQLHSRMQSCEAEKIPTLKESLAALEARLKELSH
ncbi:MAG TPA: electron transport complex subunit RsxC [Cellvibrionaceae bacterium]